MAPAKQTTLGDLCTIIDCEHKTAPTEESGIPLIRTPNIGRGRLILTDVQRISERTFKIWTRRGEPKPGDLIMAREAPVGNVAIVPRDEKVCLGQRTVLIRVKDPNVDSGYLNYLLNSTAMNAYVNLLSNGATVGHLNVSDIRKLKLPPLPTPTDQLKIAALLTAYDDLIESNQNRISLLEKLAAAIYREWFVRLRFPGHENVKLFRGIPQGWRVSELRELAAINPTSINRRDKAETILYVDISSVSTNKIEEVTTYEASKAPGRARRGVKHGDIIWSSVRPANRAYCLIYEPAENLIVSTGFAVIRPNASIPFTFLSFAVTSDAFVDQMTAVAKGAAYPATSFDDFEKAKVLVPSSTLLETFHETTEPLFRQKHLLSLQADYLASTRNMLLPRLISGKLSVENLDIRFPPGMTEN